MKEAELKARGIRSREARCHGRWTIRGPQGARMQWLRRSRGWQDEDGALTPILGTRELAEGEGVGWRVNGG